MLRILFCHWICEFLFPASFLEQKKAGDDNGLFAVVIPACVQIWSILGKKKERGEAYCYPYGKTEEIFLRILCGYQQGGEEPIPLCQKLPVTEIPVYYVKTFIYCQNYVRLKYIHDKKPDVWNFILSKKARTRIEREDGVLMPIAVPKDSVWKNKITRFRMNPEWEGGDGWYFDMENGEYAWLVNRTDAYCLNSGGVLSGLLPTS